MLYLMKTYTFPIFQAIYLPSKKPFTLTLWNTPEYKYKVKKTFCRVKISWFYNKIPFSGVEARNSQHQLDMKTVVTNFMSLSIRYSLICFQRLLKLNLKFEASDTKNIFYLLFFPSATNNTKLLGEIASKMRTKALGRVQPYKRFIIFFFAKMN